MFEHAFLKSTAGFSWSILPGQLDMTQPWISAGGCNSTIEGGALQMLFRCWLFCNIPTLASGIALYSQLMDHITFCFRPLAPDQSEEGNDDNTKYGGTIGHSVNIRHINIQTIDKVFSTFHVSLEIA